MLCDFAAVAVRLMFSTNVTVTNTETATEAHRDFQGILIETLLTGMAIHLPSKKVGNGSVAVRGIMGVPAASEKPGYISTFVTSSLFTTLSYET